MIGAFVLFACLGPYNAYVWWATTSTFFAMMTYLFVNVAVIVLNRHRILASLWGYFRDAAIPAVGVAADAYIVAQSFFIELWHQDWATGKSGVVFNVACAALALILALAARRAVAAPTEALP